jgi:hypothetical protein
MQINSWTLTLLILVWLVTGLAGISFLRQAYNKKPGPAPRGWRKFVHEIRFRLLFAAGIGLILTVISGVVWLLINFKSY